MSQYQWSRLNNQQVGAYAEYFVKMELTLHGFQVYSTEVDDRGIDFVARLERGPFIEVQVKSLRSMGYVFMQKTKFPVQPHVYLALALLLEGHSPLLYLVPSTMWLAPDAVFVDRNYEGLKSQPEWGLNISGKNMPALEAYAFETTVAKLIHEANG